MNKLNIGQFRAEKVVEGIFLITNILQNVFNLATQI